MNATLAWETLDETDPKGHATTTVVRAVVPGGWLIRSVAGGAALVFVPDPTHAWGAHAGREREIDFGE